MPRVEVFALQSGGRMLTFACPGCGRNHGIYIERENRPVWSWNGDATLPTIQPSILSRYEDGKVCHSFVTAGKIQFLADSTHELAGQTVDLPEVEF